jgi:hypothetical protein
MSSEVREQDHDSRMFTAAPVAPLTASLIALAGERAILYDPRATILYDRPIVGRSVDIGRHESLCL